MNVDVVQSSASKSASGPGFEVGLILALWRRDTLRLMRERTRWIGVVAQPLFLWVILGAGFAESLTIPGAEGVSSMQFLYPGILGMVLLFTSIFSTMSVIEDRASGFLQGVLVAPGSPLALVLGKTAGVTTIVAVQSVLFLLVAPVAGYPWGSINWPLLLLVILLANTALTCSNFVFAWVLNSTQAYHGLMSVVLMPMWIVSGAMFPPPSGVMGTVVALNPMSYAIAGLRWGMGVPAGDLPSAAWCIGVLSVCTLVSLVAAVRITRRR